MGCFIGCFGGSSRDQKRKRQRYKVILRDQKPKIENPVKADASLGQSIIESPSNLFPESREKTEVPLKLKRRKKVTFDTNVTTYEHIEVYDSTESLLEKNEKSETFPRSTQNFKDDSVVLNIPNYRYGNCLESDDEFEDLDHEEYDLDGYDDDLDDDDDDDLDDEEHFDDNDEDMKVQNRNGYVLSVLNPVENLSQWQALKSKGRPQKPLIFKDQKENLSLNTKSLKHKNLNQETSVDASLSNWLSSSHINIRNNNRPIC
ncbi:unnamed protein product [Lactuca saligna]|uniref:Uncharacterized protein n=1 Tax=Lactuca saligna TaxID=75948 RepID=A0AA35Y9Y7_LACSI|nr:unnamed protein product [Lactuca saligna]